LRRTLDNSDDLRMLFVAGDEASPTSLLAVPQKVVSRKYCERGICVRENAAWTGMARQPTTEPDAARGASDYGRPPGSHERSRYPLGTSQQPTQHAPPIAYERAIRQVILTTRLSTPGFRPRVTCGDRAKATTLPLSGAGVSATVR
jgi:hypothetical protein